MDRAPLAWIAGHAFAHPRIGAMHLAGIAAMPGGLPTVEPRVRGATPPPPPAQ